MRWTYAVFVGLMASMACGESPTEPDDEPPPVRTPDGIARSWWVFGIPHDGSLKVEIDEDNFAGSGILDEQIDLGPLSVVPPGVEPRALATVYSNDFGSTYWASAQSTSWGGDTTPWMGGVARLEQVLRFRKRAEDASLKVVITRVFMESIDGNGQAPRRSGCTWYTGERPEADECEGLMRGVVRFSLDALHLADGRPEINEFIYRTGGTARLQGFLGNWRTKALSSATADTPLWNDSSFVYTPNTAPDQGGRFELRYPVRLEIPLDSIPVGHDVILTANVFARAASGRPSESYISSFFRDPVDLEGNEVEFSGLERVDLDDPPPAPAPETPVCAVPPTGTIQFDSTAYADHEQDGGWAWISLSRTGGSTESAIARIRTNGGDATPGSDYVAADALIYFAAGEEGSRVFEIEIVGDTIVEANETVQIELVEVAGCGSVASPASAVLTIMDDDRPPLEDPTYTLGGPVNGLEGTGLVLANYGIDYDTVAVGDSFVFERRYTDGYPYNVTVRAQPTDPTQRCQVTNGQGRIDGADVTDVVVDCETLVQEEGLDPTFGAGGKVWSSEAGGVTDMVLQPDEQAIVLAGRRLDRYASNGSLDASFGTGGTVDLSWIASGAYLEAIALQPDGRIVVVGYVVTNTPGAEIVMGRVEANGTPDTSFGTNGAVTTAVGPSLRGTDVAIAADGSIYVGGDFVPGDLLDGTNFAVMKYDSSGALDTSFGSSGIAHTDIGGQTDLSLAIALQPDGKIVQTGRVANSGGADPDVAVVRYETDGSRDQTFGVDGVVRVVTDGWDQGQDIVVRSDGRIVVGGFHRPPTFEPNQFLVARFEADGRPDLTYGTDGRALVGILDGDSFLKAIAIDGDGIIAAGVASDEFFTRQDFGIVRLDASGAVDEAFAIDGRQVIDFFGEYDAAEAVAIQADGRVWVGGSVQNGGRPVVGLTRLLLPS